MTRKLEVVAHKQSLLKSIIWRIMGVIILASVTYFFTRHWIITTKITITHHAFFLIVFYLHERLWSLLKKTGTWRNIIKSFTYEIILGMGFGGLIVFFYTGSFPMVTRVTGTYTVIKIIMYFIYDKAWSEFKK